MIYLTQLIYLHEGQEAVFDQFEAVAIPLIAQYRGQLLFRIRPQENDFIEISGEKPYELHLATFPTEQDFQEFARDESRRQWLHLKEQSIRSVLLIQGVAI
ncbi:hypothetical protein GCM10027051_12870 [Niabella terrae]